MSAQKVLDALESNSISFKVLFHNDFGQINSPYDFASLSHTPIKQIAKSMLLKAGDSYVVAVLPVSKKVNLEAIGQVFNESKVKIAPLEDLSDITGYDRFATTAIGLDLRVVVDSLLLNEEKIYVATGSLGEELEINPKDLIKITNAKVSPITQ